MKKKVNESASAGATSAGSIASTPGGLNFPLIRRMPPTNIFNSTSEVYRKSKKKNGK